MKLENFRPWLTNL